MTFDVMSKNEIRYITRAHPYAVISITEPRTRRVSLRVDPNRIATLWRMFDDVGYAAGTERDIRSSYFTTTDADTILDFVARCVPLVSEIIVHCDAGTSRSRGVAVALGLIYGDPTPHHLVGHPNTLVIRTLLERHAARGGTPIALPTIVRFVKRCPYHQDRAPASSAIDAKQCPTCGGDLETMPIDLMTDTILAHGMTVALAVASAARSASSDGRALGIRLE